MHTASFLILLASDIILKYHGIIYVVWKIGARSNEGAKREIKKEAFSTASRALNYNKLLTKGGERDFFNIWEFYCSYLTDLEKEFLPTVIHIPSWQSVWDSSLHMLLGVDQEGLYVSPQGFCPTALWQTSEKVWDVFLVFRSFHKLLMACPLQKIHFVVHKAFFDDLFWIIILREGQFLPKTKFFEGCLLGFHDFTSFGKISRPVCSRTTANHN